MSSRQYPAAFANLFSSRYRPVSCLCHLSSCRHPRPSYLDASLSRFLSLSDFRSPSSFRFCRNANYPANLSFWNPWRVAATGILCPCSSLSETGSAHGLSLFPALFPFLFPSPSPAPSLALSRVPAPFHALSLSRARAPSPFHAPSPSLCLSLEERRSCCVSPSLCDPVMATGCSSAMDLLGLILLQFKTQNKHLNMIRKQNIQSRTWLEVMHGPTNNSGCR